MNARKQRLEAVFDAAIELTSPEQRAVYLSKACGEDQQLRREIDELLQAYEKAGGFLAATLSEESGERMPVGRTSRTAEASSDIANQEVCTTFEKLGDCIGRYKLLQKIGEGGCGVVYMAEQEEPVRRRVALKIIKLGMDTKSVIARFEAERQALAMMDHPNIAKVFDAGSTDATLPQEPRSIRRESDHYSQSAPGNQSGLTSAATIALSAGRPYFVMELVRGIKITDYCNESNLSTRERLDLFIPRECRRADAGRRG